MSQVKHVNSATVIVNEESLRKHLVQVIAAARSLGLDFTVTHTPLMPLSMGHKRPVIGIATVKGTAARDAAMRIQS